MSVGEYFDIGDPALQIRADEDGMKDPLNLLREAFDIYDSKKAPWEQSKAYFEKLKEFCDYSEKLSKEGSVMTREEAIAILQEKYDYCKSFYDLAARPKEDYAETAQYLQALQVALTALRGPTREQVEKVWRGEWIDTRESSKDVPTCMCSRCTRVVVGLESKFCPDCGAPMTDKAVQMVMERMEEMKNG